MMERIAVLITCHNRREKTLACLQALFANALPDGVNLHVILVDDGSTDGSSEAIATRYPAVEIIKGDGSLFWNRGMYVAFEKAMAIGFDRYLWLNDDTILNPKAISLLLQTRITGNEIVVGAICDPETGMSSYGGAQYIDPVFRPFLCGVVIPDGHPQQIDTMNGNVVLIPHQTASKIGNLDPLFEHAMGDIDYSMRARKLGIIILLTGHFVATCARNGIEGTYQDKTLPAHKRIRHLFSRKGRPPRSWLRMCLRHGGFLWPFHFVWGYAKAILFI